jgi:hypothetical protein
MIISRIKASRVRYKKRENTLYINNWKFDFTDNRKLICVWSATSLFLMFWLIKRDNKANMALIYTGVKLLIHTRFDAPV